MKDRAYDLAIIALRRALLAVKPGLALTARGYANHWSDNLLPGIDPAWFEEELNEGDGQELKNKFKAAHSSSALAVNTFARFKSAPTMLSVASWSGCETFRFEAKCSAGIVKRRPPNLDVLAKGSKILGIESKCTEHLKKHVPIFSAAYDEQIKDDARRSSSWFRLMKVLETEPIRYQYLDSAQLIKHAFGLAYCFPNHDVTLLYIYWEPQNALEFREFREHRSEVARFSEMVKDSSPVFKAISYRDLWDEWGSLMSPTWLPEHLTVLRARYDIVI